MAGVFDRTVAEVEKDMVFVLMPFSESFNALYRILERCCTDEGLRCERADSDAKPGKITGKIYQCIKRAGIVIADMTGRNANVFYELGLAHAVSDDVILLTQNRDDIPFDLREFLHIEYANSLEGAEKLAKDLAKAITSIRRSTGASFTADGSTTPRMGMSIVDDADDVGLLQIQAELARKNGHRDEARRLLGKALQLVEQGRGDADSVGNCAIEAEAARFRDYAEQLYELALQRDAGHVNNRQCYVSFLLDEFPGDPQRVAKAKDLLDTLETLPERRERTRALRAQYLSIKGRASSASQTEMEEILRQISDDTTYTTLEEATPALALLSELGRVDDFRKVVEKVRLRASTADKTILDRALGDCLAKSTRSDYRDEAIAIYRRLVLGGTREPDLLHNLATILNVKDHMDAEGEACSLWTEAYRGAPNDPIIRRAFAQYLLRKNRPKDAQAVLDGQPIV